MIVVEKNYMSEDGDQLCIEFYCRRTEGKIYVSYNYPNGLHEPPETYIDEVRLNGEKVTGYKALFLTNLIGIDRIHQEVLDKIS